MITIRKNHVVSPHQTFLFPGGEVGVKLSAIGWEDERNQAPYQEIVARLQNANDILELVMVANAMRQIDDTPIRLFMPYVPYGRQDRVCNLGEAHSLRAFGDLINSLHFQRVTVVDPHSDVTPGVLNNVRVISQLDVINKFDDFIRFVMTSNSVFVAPDAGANKKTSTLAGYFGHKDFVRADKLRDLETGKIKETVVYVDDLKGATAIIADDICDGGASFTALAQVLKRKGAGKVVLYVTHGIFSKGEEVLYKAGIDDIYTTTSWTTSVGQTKALDLEAAFL